MQTIKTKKSHRRLAIAVTLFSASILSSFLFSYLAQMGDSYWVTSRPLARGVLVASSDVQLRKMTLSQGISGYLSHRTNPIGSITRRNMQAMQVLHTSDVSENANDLTTQNISLSLRSSDIPRSTSEGDVVSLYHVYESRNGEEVPSPQEILTGVFIRDIAEANSNFGGEKSVTVSVIREMVPALLAATSVGRIVMVSSGG